MKNKITDLHHITALTSDPQQNVDFYAGILGLRLVKGPSILTLLMFTIFTMVM